MNLKLSQDRGDKPGDPVGEPRRRSLALSRVQEALGDEVRVREEARRRTARAVERAVWSGASLADLANLTGHSRQAARKRWPELGGLARRRRWLSYHVEEILWSARLVLEHADALPAEVTAGLGELTDTAAAAFVGDDSGHDDDPAARWLVLESLVDRHLRIAAGAAPAATDQARFACDGAFGVVAYYDHAIDQDIPDS